VITESKCSVSEIPTYFEDIKARNKSINVLNGFESLPSFKGKTQDFSSAKK
jgi:hypothetical protein